MDTKTEAAFRALVRRIIRTEGRVPGPTRLTTEMGWRGRANVLGGRYSRIRIEELEGAGYVRHTDHPSDRWHLPEGCRECQAERGS